MSNHVITITPTIPVRRHEIRGLPKITFATPPEVDVLQTSCVIELREGIEPVQVTIKAACKQDEITEGLKPIVPSIYFTNSPFWNARVGLPTIWVCILVCCSTYIISCTLINFELIGMFVSLIDFAPKFTSLCDFHSVRIFLIFENSEFKLDSRKITVVRFKPLCFHKLRMFDFHKLVIKVLTNCFKLFLFMLILFIYLFI